MAFAKGNFKFTNFSLPRARILLAEERLKEKGKKRNNLDGKEGKG